LTLQRCLLQLWKAPRKAEEEPLLGLNLRSKAKKESKTSQTQEEFKNKEA
jgi:hypothetical protein